MAAPVSDAALESESYENVYDVVERIKEEEQSLYADHGIKEEMMIGSTDIQQPEPDAASMPLMKTEPCEDPVHDGFYGSIPLEPLDKEQVYSLLYPEHEVKEEMVIGPTVVTRPVSELEDNKWARIALAAVGSESESQRLLSCRVEVRDVASELLCARCGQWWLTAAELERHHLTHAAPISAPVTQFHQDVTAFICDKCDKQFIWKSSFIRHLGIHNRVKPYCCNQCDKQFIRKLDLITHRNTHSGLKPFSCSQCGKQQFSHESNLCRHLLEDEIEELQKGGRKYNFEIKNVPKMKDETKDDLLNMVINLSQSIDYKIHAGDIKDIYRVHGNRDGPSNTPIIVEMVSTIMKTETVQACKAFSKKNKTQLCAKHLGLKSVADTPVFISEQLTAKGASLFSLARDLAKSKKYKFCWTAYGKVYVRKSEVSPVITITNDTQVLRLMQEG